MEEQIGMRSTDCRVRWISHSTKPAGRMAYDAAEKYKDIDFDICYCSPLKRAQETARIFLADRNPAVEIITDNRLRDVLR